MSEGGRHERVSVYRVRGGAAAAAVPNRANRDFRFGVRPSAIRGHSERLLTRVTAQCEKHPPSEVARVNGMRANRRPQLASLPHHTTQTRESPVDGQARERVGRSPTRWMRSGQAAGSMTTNAQVRGCSRAGLCGPFLDFSSAGHRFESCRGRHTFSQVRGTGDHLKDA